MYMSEYWQKVNTFVKTKNAPYGIKRKINPQFFFWTEASQIGGVGGGSDIWEKLPKNPVFFFWQAPLVVESFCNGDMAHNLVSQMKMIRSFNEF